MKKYDSSLKLSGWSLFYQDRLGSIKGPILYMTKLGSESGQCSHVKLSLRTLLSWPHVKVSVIKGVWKSQCLRIGWKFQDLLIRHMGMSTNFFGAQLCLVLKQWPSENFGVKFWNLLKYQISFYAKLTPCKSITIRIYEWVVSCIIYYKKRSLMMKNSQFKVFFVMSNETL